MDHRTAVSLTGSAAAVSGGVLGHLFAAVEGGSNVATAGLGMAAVGIVTAIAPLYFKDRSEARQMRLKELQADLTEAKARIAELEVQGAKVAANEVRIAGTEGGLDGLIEALAASGTLTPAVPDPKPGRSPRPTILVAEDDPATAYNLRKLLTKFGFSVSVAPTVEEGRRLLDLGPHWLLLDLKLQGEDGLELLRYSRGLARGVRCAILSGTADPDRLAEARGLSPEAIWIKPVPFGDLIGLLLASASAPRKEDSP